MTVDKELLDSLTAQAKESPRLRVAFDLRTTPEDGSQRILNALEPGTVLPIHRHRGSTETVVVLRGRIQQNFYSLTPAPSPESKGRLTARLTDSVICAPCTDTLGFSIPVGQWHNTECLESGTVILECKDGKYEPLGEEDILG